MKYEVWKEKELACSKTVMPWLFGPPSNICCEIRIECANLHLQSQNNQRLKLFEKSPTLSGSGLTIPATALSKIYKRVPRQAFPDFREYFWQRRPYTNAHIWLYGFHSSFNVSTNHQIFSLKYIYVSSSKAKFIYRCCQKRAV